MHADCNLLEHLCIYYRVLSLYFVLQHKELLIKMAQRWNLTLSNGTYKVSVIQHKQAVCRMHITARQIIPNETKSNIFLRLWICCRLFRNTSVADRSVPTRKNLCPPRTQKTNRLFHLSEFGTQLWNDFDLNKIKKIVQISIDPRVFNVLMDVQICYATASVVNAPKTTQIIVTFYICAMCQRRVSRDDEE